MSAIKLHLLPDTEDALRAKAAQAGLTVEAYLRQLAERDAAEAPGSADELSAAEFERLLDDLAGRSPLPPLPADFCRADIYQTHD
jgi:hypothetical protein